MGFFEVRGVVTGRFRLDGGAMFGVVPKVLWEKTDPADGDNRIAMAMRILYAERGGMRLVVDAGAGDKLGEKMIRNYRIESPPLRERLAGEGIDPDAVTHAVMTHLHFDHAGGFTWRNGDGRLQLAFPNATHFVQQSQWEAALDPNEKDRASFFPEDFLPIEEAGRLEMLDGEKEIAPGVRVIPTSGHTPGHQTVLLEGNGEALLYGADLLPLASHVNLPWIMAYDHRPLDTLEEKKRLLKRAADENWILFFEHDPRIAACRVRRNEKGRFEATAPVELR
ncbi:MAG: MBL fold metallo-hydrolase [Candidatus Krumholzibacteriota bacterium]|nr:MBL fold metallo-hydrolase [Candidatus Krumholzibacteriota bacterium]